MHIYHTWILWVFPFENGYLEAIPHSHACPCVFLPENDKHHGSPRLAGIIWPVDGGKRPPELTVRS